MRKIILSIIIGFVSIVLLLYISLRVWLFFKPDLMNQVKRLGNNYGISYFCRDTYYLTYYPIGYSSSSVPVVVDDAVSRVEFDRRWIFMYGVSGACWVIDKTIPYGDVPAQDSTMVVYGSSVIGPIDSLTIDLFKDSVGFTLSTPKNSWHIDDH